MSNTTVVVCSAAWKECFAPSQANDLLATILHIAHPDWDIRTFSLSDGGDGFLETVAAVVPENTVAISHEVMGPLPGQRVMATVLYDPEACRLWVEAADIHGMRRLPAHRKCGLTATSTGVGEMIRTVANYPDTPVREVILSLGGSASTDAGMGFLQGLGWTLLDNQGHPLPPGIGAGDLQKIAAVHPPETPLKLDAFTVVVDVHALFLEAPRLFGPQKGLTPEQIQTVTQSFQTIAAVLDPGNTIAALEGSGTAGGIAMGILTAFPEAKIISGMDWLAANSNLYDLLARADWIITGEGCLDATSLAGKGTGAVLAFAAERGIPTLVCCGKSSLTAAELPAQCTVLPLCVDDKFITPEDFVYAADRLRTGFAAALPAIAPKPVGPPV